MKISATIITLNEEKNIGDCLKSLDFASEIVVVDSGSTDLTGEICRAHPNVRFFSRPWEGFGRQKNMAAELASHDWIFNIDADERVSKRLMESICSADTDTFNGFKVARENYFGNRRIRHGGWYPDYNLRLYDRRCAAFTERAVHEAVQCRGATSTLEGNLVHKSYEDIGDFVRRMDRYADLAAGELVRGGRRPGTCSILLRPPFTFVKMYLLKRGFLDGYAGLLLSLLYSVYTMLKYARAREILDRKPAGAD